MSLFTSQGHVAMKEASLEDEAQYTGTAHPLLLPSCQRAEKQGGRLIYINIITVYQPTFYTNITEILGTDHKDLFV